MRLDLYPLSALLGVLLVSCSTYPGPSAGRDSGPGYLAGLGLSTTERSVNPAEAASFWDGDTVDGSPSIRINRGEQKAYFYKGGQLVGLSPISSGDTEHPTPPGSFRVTEKSPDHESSLYGRIVDAATGQTLIEDADTRVHKPGPGEKFIAAPMPHFLRFNGGVGMHAGHLPGYAASHGCVRLPAHMAEKFFEHARIGTPVIVE